MNTELLIEKHSKELVAHAMKEAPLEACGVFVVKNKRTSYIPCVNTHTSPNTDFECYKGVVELEDKGFTIVGVFHSHTNGNNKLSPMDKVAMEACRLPYIMYSTESNTFDCASPSFDEVPYKGRQYVGGVQDCYTLVRDYHLREKQIVLKDFFRCDKWWDKGMDVLTEDNFRQAGFSKVALQDIREGDVIVMRIGKKNDHLGIYLGNQRFLHHCYNRLSCEDMYGGVWLKHTTSIQRYIGEENECPHSQQ